VESSTYCAAIWLPAIGVMVWRRVLALDPEASRIRGRMVACCRWFTVPVGMFVTSFAAIHLYYLCFLGHGPDWIAWAEYARAFAGGYYAMPIDPKGTVWALLLVFGMVSCGVAVYIRREGLGDRLALLTGAWGALWAVSSYFVSRSHENNGTCLSPFLCLVVAIVLHVFANRLETHRFLFLLKVAATPLFTLLIAASFGDRLILGNFLHDLPKGYTRRIDRRLPVIDPTLVDLLESAGADPRDPLVFLESETTESLLLPAWPSTTPAPVASSYTAWLPVAPAMLLAPLPEERRRVYCRRFTDRTHMGGWLIRPNGPTKPSMAWCIEQIHESHVIGATCFRNAKWQISWVEYKSTERLARLKRESLEE
jgi:hypothetical protein